MTMLWSFGEVSTLVHTNGDVRMCGLLQKIKLANHTAIVKLRSHVRTVRVLMEEIGGHGRCFLDVGAAPEMKILNDRINQLWLHQLDGSVTEFLHLYAQEVTNVALVIY